MHPAAGFVNGISCTHATRGFTPLATVCSHLGFAPTFADATKRLAEVKNTLRLKVFDDLLRAEIPHSFQELKPRTHPEVLWRAGGTHAASTDYGDYLTTHGSSGQPWLRCMGRRI